MGVKWVLKWGNEC